MCPELMSPHSPDETHFGTFLSLQESDNLRDQSQFHSIDSWTALKVKYSEALLSVKQFFGEEEKAIDEVCKMVRCCFTFLDNGLLLFPHGIV